jgi:hypothetical protein
VVYAFLIFPHVCYMTHLSCPPFIWSPW